MTPALTTDDLVWDAVEAEKRRDRFIRRVSVAAWTVTFAVVLVLGAMVGSQVRLMARRAEVGMVSWSAVVNAAMPFVVVVGILSVLIATLATVGIFLRLRTASLLEIQLRLAALEGMLVSRSDA